MSAKKIADVRARIARLKSEIEATEAMRAPIEAVEASLRAALAAITERASRPLRALADEAKNLRPNFAHVVRQDHGEFADLALALVLRRHADELIAEVMGALELDAPRMPATQADARLLELRSELYALELVEAELVFAEGGTTAHRPDATAAAVLGIPHEDAIQRNLIA